MLKNDQIWPEIGISDHCWLIWCPVDGLAGGFGARAVSRKTPIYFIGIMIFDLLNFGILNISDLSLDVVKETKPQ